MVASAVTSAVTSAAASAVTLSSSSSRGGRARSGVIRLGDEDLWGSPRKATDDRSASDTLAQSLQRLAAADGGWLTLAAPALTAAVVRLVAFVTTLGLSMGGLIR